MPIKFDYYIPKLFAFALIILASAGFTFLVNFNALEIVNRPTKTISADTFDTDIANLHDDDNVTFSGTINYLRVIADSGESIYYTGFEEFGDKLIVKISKKDFEGSSLKNIHGSVKTLDNSAFTDSLLSKLNEVGNISEINASELNQLDQGVKEKIAENLKGNFTDKSILIIEGQRFEREKVYLETLLLGVFSSVFLLILLREKVIYS